MKKIDVGRTVNTLANIGVIAGIVFLAIEIRQNQALLDEGNRIDQRALEISSLERFSDFRSQLAEDEQLAEIWLKGVADNDLNDVESLRFQQLCQNLFWTNGVMAKHFSESGMTDVETWATGIHAQISSSNRLRDCWDNLSQQNMRVFSNDAFVDAVENGGQKKSQE
jgi:hypothetical protein